MNANEDIPCVVEEEKGPVRRRVCEGHNEAGIVLPPLATDEAGPEPAEGVLETAEGKIGGSSMEG